MIGKILEIIEQAGALVPSHSGVSSAKKPDGSPVTEVDIEIERLILARLRELAPEIPIVSEESGVVPAETRAHWRRFWLVDPLDGTKEFLAGRDDFTLNIALIEDQVPVLGAVSAPRSGVVYYATREQGSWKREPGQPPVRLRSRPPKPGAPVSIAESRSHPSPELEKFLAGLQVKERIQLGSSLKLCLVAEGRVDLYPRFGPTMEWDVAAGDAVFRYSGEERPRRCSLIYNKPDMRNGSFVLGLE
jgi:3'(2'), 5'-bisphosphate nucleotidase